MENKPTTIAVANLLDEVKAMGLY
ncbi:MAG: hypothetical protein FD183_1542, partial [Chitinophagaceae bacterium]